MPESLQSLELVKVIPWDEDDRESRRHRSVLGATQALIKLKKAVEETVHGRRLDCAPQLLFKLAHEYNSPTFSEAAAKRFLEAFEGGLTEWSKHTSMEDVVSTLSFDYSVSSQSKKSLADLQPRQAVGPQYAPSSDGCQQSGSGACLRIAGL